MRYTSTPTRGRPDTPSPPRRRKPKRPANTTGYVAGSPKGGSTGTVRRSGTRAPTTDTRKRAEHRQRRRAPLSAPRRPPKKGPVLTRLEAKQEKLTKRPKAQLSTPKLDPKPKTFAGRPTAGTPTRVELSRAQRTGRLGINRKGFVTTPKVRRVSRTLKRAKRASRKQGPKIKGVVHGPQAERFAKRLAQRTGLDARAVGAWVNAEGGGFAAGGEAGRNNWLGVGYPGEQTEFSRSAHFNRSPEKAAEATAAWMRGKIGGEYGYAAAQGIREIIPKAKGKGPEAFLRALDESGWGTNVSSVAQNLSGVSARPGNPRVLRRLTRAKRQARKLGLAAGRRPPGSANKLPGPYDGSRSMVRKIVGSKVRGDKETTGHSSTGDHDPSQPNAYAQDINVPAGNRAENEPGFTQGTLNRMVKNLRKLGAKVPKLTLGSDNWEGTVKGYRIQVLTIPHGSGPHIHVGARWTGESSAPGVSFGGSDIAAYAQGTGQSVGQVEKRLRKGKLTGLEILEKLRDLGVGVEIPGPQERPPEESAMGTPVLKRIQREQAERAAP